MFLKAEISTEYSSVNTSSISALGTYDDTNGKYYMLNILLTNGTKISWKYDDKKKRDDKFAEAISDTQ